MDNTFATETFPDDISAKSPEVFKKCYNVEPDGQRSFATYLRWPREHCTGFHYAHVAMSYYLIR